MPLVESSPEMAQLCHRMLASEGLLCEPIADMVGRLARISKRLARRSNVCVIKSRLPVATIALDRLRRRALGERC